MLEFPRPMPPLAVQMIAEVPPFIQDDPLVQAVMYVQAKESDRILERISQLTDYAFPLRTNSTGMMLLEALVGLTIGPSDTLANRRAAVMTQFRRLTMSASTSDFLDFIQTLVGPSFTYQEHYPYNPTGDVPPEYTVQISLPFPSDSDYYNRAERLIRMVAPAHIDLVVTSQSGFGLDFGRLDEDALG
jgi:hypothetical protein